MKAIIMPETNIQEQPVSTGLPIVGISDSTPGGTLKESEDNFRTFVETIDDMVIVATREGRIRHARTDNEVFYNCSHA